MEDLSRLFQHSSLYFLDKSSELTPHLLDLRSRLILPESISGYHEKRRAEFILGRLCAAMAFKESFGGELLELPLTGESRVPCWPNGVVGSISHSRHLVVAAVGDKKKLLGLGIDLEEKDRVKSSLSKNILTIHDLKEKEGLSEKELLTLIFSAKESLYKALYPVVNQYFGFDKACVTSIDIENNTFQIDLLEELSAEFNPKKRFQFAGKFAFKNQHVLTLIEIPHL